MIDAPASAAVVAICNILSQVLGYAVDPEGYAKLTMENQLKFLARAHNEAIDKGDWPAVQSINNEYRRLRQETRA